MFHFSSVCLFASLGSTNLKVIALACLVALLLEISDAFDYSSAVYLSFQDRMVVEICAVTLCKISFFSDEITIPIT